MKAGEQVPVMLLWLVSGIYATWREKVCEGKYNGKSCLGSYPCMEAFLRCDCIPLQFAGQKFEELCWTSLAYEVGAPTCCINVEKRKHSLIKREKSNSNNIIRDVISSMTRHHQKYGNRINTVLKTSTHEKTIQNEKSTDRMNDPRNEQNSLTSRLGQNDQGNMYVESIHNPMSVKLADKIRNVPQQNLVTDIVAAVVQSWKALKESKHGSTNKRANNISVFNDLNIDDTVEKSNEDEIADPYHNYEALTKNSEHFNVVSSQYDNGYDMFSVAGPLTEDSENVIIPTLLQIPSENEKDERKLDSLPKVIQKRTRENLDLMQSRILEALYNVKNKYIV